MNPLPFGMQSHVFTHRTMRASTTTPLDTPLQASRHGFKDCTAIFVLSRSVCLSLYLALSLSLSVPLALASTCLPSFIARPYLDCKSPTPRLLEYATCTASDVSWPSARRPNLKHRLGLLVKGFRFRVLFASPLSFFGFRV